MEIELYKDTYYVQEVIERTELEEAEITMDNVYQEWLKQIDIHNYYGSLTSSLCDKDYDNMDELFSFLAIDLMRLTADIPKFKTAHPEVKDNFNCILDNLYKSMSIAERNLDYQLKHAQLCKISNR